MDVYRFVGADTLSGASSSSQVCYSLTEVSKRLRDLVEGAVQSVWVATAFIDRCGVDLLKKAGSRGAQVRVLTSAEVDEDILRELARLAEVRVVKDKFMHAKMYIVDGKALIGSANLTCPVLEGKNIEILCEVSLEEAVKRFNELWTSAGGVEALLQSKELWIRIRDTPQRVVIESRIGPRLHIEIDRLLKRLMFRVNEKKYICSPMVEGVCIKIDSLAKYEELVSSAIQFINSLSIHPCVWRAKVELGEVEITTHCDFVSEFRELCRSREVVSPVAFIVIGLKPVVEALYSEKLLDMAAQMLSNWLRGLDTELEARCYAKVERSMYMCVNFFDKVSTNVIYLFTYSYSTYPKECEALGMEADKKFEGLEGRFINEVLNNIKTVFESEVRKRYEDYKAMLQRYGSKPIEIDGELKAKLSIRLFSKNYTHEVVLGYL
jgi:hypothetical protein